MSEIKINDVTYGIDKIGEAVERWLARDTQKPSKTSKCPSLYKWMIGDMTISLEKFKYGYVISSQCPSFGGMTKDNLVKITPPFNVEIIPLNPNIALEALVHEIKMIPDMMETKQKTNEPKNDFIPKGDTPSMLIKNITFNTVKGITTVVFDDNTKVMTKTTEGEKFNPEIGLAMCIAKKLYGSRANFKKVVKFAMDKSSKGNEKRMEKQKKKDEEYKAAKEHVKAQIESYVDQLLI